MKTTQEILIENGFDASNWDLNNDITQAATVAALSIADQLGNEPAAQRAAAQMVEGELFRIQEGRAKQLRANADDMLSNALTIETLHASISKAEQ